MNYTLNIRNINSNLYIALIILIINIKFYKQWIYHQYYIHCYKNICFLHYIILFRSFPTQILHLNVLGKLWRYSINNHIAIRKYALVKMFLYLNGLDAWIQHPKSISYHKSFGNTHPKLLTHWKHKYHIYHTPIALLCCILYATTRREETGIIKCMGQK